ncbi:MAG TPA: CHAT domain-containing protein, partial [Chloroflexota bacterium]
MISYAELEIGLRPRGRDSFFIDLTYSGQSPMESDAEVRSSVVGQDKPLVGRLDRDDLRQLALGSEAYGRALNEALFKDPRVKSMFDSARASAEASDAALRLRLFIGPGAPHLHSVRWETLRDPRTGGPLVTGENVVFSRYLSSIDWRPVPLRVKGELRALVAIANPSELQAESGIEVDGRPLPPIDVEGERDRALTSLGIIPAEVLASGGQATISNLIAHLRAGKDGFNYDILYLVCHGTAARGESELWLESDDGHRDIVSGSDFVDRISQLPRRPRLVVLASCQSAGKGDEARSSDDGVLAALGPQLAEAGVPAVLAMQGDVLMQTVERFMPRFFSELQEHGQVDRAVAVARGEVRKARDWWAPALFMRLKSGRMWYVPGFGATTDIPWAALVSAIKEGAATAILGPALTESVVGSRQAIARSWASLYQFPMAPHNRENLAQVAQYLSISQAPAFLRQQLKAHMRKELLRRYANKLEDSEGASLDELIIRLAGHSANDPADPHRILAELPFRIYIATGPTDILKPAFATIGKVPEVEMFEWRSRRKKVKGGEASVFKREPTYRPTDKRPLVYHLFGRLEDEESVVLTEDDYLEYLVGWRSKSGTIPGVVNTALKDGSLLFLGFRPDDWVFRVLYHVINDSERGDRRSQYANVAVQIDPEEGQIIEPAGARRYLEKYFLK